MKPACRDTPQLKNLTKHVIGHLALLEKYGPLYPRLTKSSRHDEIDAKEAAFKAFKVAYDRASGYLGYKVSGEEFKTDCTKFDKILMVFKDGPYKVIELPEKLFVGPDMIYCGLPNREQVFTLAYSDRDATYLKRFTFGGYILDKDYFCVPEGQRCKVQFLAPETPAVLYIREAGAVSKIHQQTCVPGEVDVKGAKTAAAKFDQGRLQHHRRANARLGSRSADDEGGVCVKWPMNAKSRIPSIPIEDSISYEDWLARNGCSSSRPRG